MPLLPLRLWTSRRAIEDLHRRLDAARWPLVPFHEGGAAGTDDLALRALVRRWRFDFDWFAVEERWNRLAHVRGPVAAEGSEELHAVLFAPADAGLPPPRLPLLLLHGWPGAFAQYLEVAARLAEAGHEVVVPSMPGAGYADPPRAPGTLAPHALAERFDLLMRRLGHRRYVVAGEGTGALAALALAEHAPAAVAAAHVAALPGRGRGRVAFVREEPASAAYALHDSPVGLLAWLLPPLQDVAPERVLELATLHWLTGAAWAGLRGESEALRAPELSSPADVRVDQRDGPPLASLREPATLAGELGRLARDAG